MGCEELRTQKADLLSQISDKQSAIATAYGDMLAAYTAEITADSFPGGPVATPLSDAGIMDRCNELAALLGNPETDDAVTIALTACEVLYQKYNEWLTLTNDLTVLQAALSAVVQEMFNLNCDP